MFLFKSCFSKLANFLQTPSKSICISSWKLCKSYFTEVVSHQICKWMKLTMSISGYKITKRSQSTVVQNYNHIIQSPICFQRFLGIFDRDLKLFMDIWQGSPIRKIRISCLPGEGRITSCKTSTDWALTTEMLSWLVSELPCLPWR